MLDGVFLLGTLGEAVESPQTGGFDPKWLQRQIWS